jgi:Protein of unknown function (DUF4238)
MGDARRHHYVPEMIQGRFTDASGHIFLFDKRHPESGVFGTAPKNAFVERDLNTIIASDGSRDVGLEYWYSELESEAAPVIEKIVKRASQLLLPRLTVDERSIWDNFVYHQQKRAPDVFERLGLISRFAADLEHRIAEFEREVRPLTVEEKTEIYSPEAAHRMIQTASVKARGSGSEAVIEAYSARGIVVAVIPEAFDNTKRFVLGDHPLARMGHGELRNQTTELWMPIAPNIAVSPWGRPMTEELQILTKQGVLKINRVIASQSNVIGGQSKQLIELLAERHLPALRLPSASRASAGKR